MKNISEYAEPGEVVELMGKHYRVEKDEEAEGSCDGCAFHKVSCHFAGPCDPEKREDATNIIFKEETSMELKLRESILVKFDGVWEERMFVTHDYPCVWYSKRVDKKDVICGIAEEWMVINNLLRYILDNPSMSFHYKNIEHTGKELLAFLPLNYNEVKILTPLYEVVL